MRSEEKLRESYLRQKAIFDEAENRRINNCNKQIAELETKKATIDHKILELKERISSRKEFESFESFRSKSLALSNKSKGTTGVS